MTLPVLMVDKYVEDSETEQAAWRKHGITSVRVHTMQEAIEKLTKENFLFVAINADNVSYLPLLKVMRSTVQGLIFIVDSHYTKEKEIEALHNGADVYTIYDKNIEVNIRLALAQLLKFNERDKPQRKLPGMIIYEQFLVLSDSRRIFYNDQKLHLSKIEYDILHTLIINHDLSLSYDKIYSKVWGRDYDKAGHKSLWDYICKIRKILNASSGEKEYIITERDVGYRFSSNYSI